MNRKPLPRATCLDCQAEFARCRALRRLANTIVPTGESDILVCPECGSYVVKEHSMTTKPKDLDSDHCTVLFRLRNGSKDAGRFVFALACFVERWRDVDVVSLQVADVDYDLSHQGGSASRLIKLNDVQTGVDHEQH